MVLSSDFDVSILQDDFENNYPPPLLIYEPLDEDDNVKLVFTEPINFPDAIQNFTSENQGKEYFEISLQLSETTKATLYEMEVDTDIEIAWELAVPNNSTLTFEITFTPSDLVSADGLDPDRLKIKFLQADHFVG